MSRDRRACVAILVVLAIGTRVPGLSFALPRLVGEVDERCIVETAVGIFGGDWRPSHFRYPMLSIDLARISFQRLAWWWRLTGQAADAAHVIARYDVDVTPFFLVARALSLAAGLGTIALVAAIGRRLAGPRAGLVAGAILALNPLHIELSRSARVDALLVLCLTAVLFLALRYVADARPLDLILMAIAGGLALATKYSAVLFLPFIALVSLACAPATREGTFASRLARCLAACAIPLALYAALDLHAVRRPDDLLGWILHQADHVGIVGSGRKPPSPTFYGRLLLGGAFGVGLLLSTAVGSVALVRRDRASGIVMLLFPLPYLLAFGTSRPAFDRYLLPIIPVLAILAALGLLWVAERLGRRAWLVALVVFAPTAPHLAGRVAVDALDADTRLRAVRWVERNVPAGSKVFLIDEGRSMLPLGDSAAPALSTRFWLRDQLKTRPEIARRAATVSDSLRSLRETPLYRVLPLDVTNLSRREAAMAGSPVIWIGGRKGSAPAQVLESHSLAAAFHRSRFCEGPEVFVYMP